MAKLRDAGHALAADRPVRLKVYRSTQLPLASEAGAGALIYINDPDDGNPRGVLAVSNGASWDEQALKGEGTSPGGPAPVAGVALRELADIKLRLDASEQAIGTLQGGLRRLERARPDAAPVEAPDNSAVETPASFPDVTASLLPIERRLAQLEADYSNEVAYQMAYRYLSPDGIEKQLAAKWITAEAEAMGAEPEAYAQAIVKQRVDRHDAVMAQRLAAIRGKA